MIYGATGYTGRLIAAEAKGRGLTPTLAGRHAGRVRAVAEEFGLPWTTFPVDDQQAVDAALRDQAAVLSVAGPFSATAQQMVESALRTKTHYLDVTGELAVFDHVKSRHGDAVAAGIALIPGVGFDVVPSDCLAAHTAKRAKAPVALRLAIDALGSMSRGTTKTGVETLGYGTFVRKAGELVSHPVGSLRATFDLGDGTHEFMAVSWGDVSTAFHTTGIGDIEVYFPARADFERIATLSRLLGPLLRLGWFQRLLKKQVDRQKPGPDDRELADTNAILLAEVTDAHGQLFRSRLVTPNAYALTADSAVTCIQKVLAAEDGKLAGYHTPATAFGAGLVSSLRGCRLEDL